MSKTVLLLGSGRKEHAWAEAIKKSNARIISWAPAINPGVKRIASQIIEAEYNKDIKLIKKWKDQIDLAIIGQTQPMFDGLGDWLESIGIPTFNPSARNARLEASKSYMREFLTRNDIDGNIAYHICRSIEDAHNLLENEIQVAIKPDGLSGGEGVRVYGDHFQSKDEIIEFATNLMEEDGLFVIEELLEGIEFTLQGFVNGTNIVFLPLVKDYKRAYDDNKGPNTGSMGSCSFSDHNLPYLKIDDLEKAKNMMKSVLIALERENGPYVGALYGQFMLTTQGPKIIEFNTRLGDPEAINTLSLLETPLLEVIRILKESPQELSTVKFNKQATCAIYLVPQGFPENTQIGTEFTISKNLVENSRIAYVGETGGSYTTTKKRSLIVIGKGQTVPVARKNAYDLIPNDIPLRYRSDIAAEFT